MKRGYNKRSIELIEGQMHSCTHMNDLKERDENISHFLGHK